jgi:hypothetical protein
MVQREARDDGLERRRVAEGLDRRPPEDLTLGRLGVDRDDLVAGGGESAGKLAAPAADLEDPARRRRELRLDELLQLAGLGTTNRSS